MLLYRASLPLSRRTLAYATGVVCRHRRAIGSKGRCLPPGMQALMTLVYLRKGDTYAELGAGFGISTCACRKLRPRRSSGMFVLVEYSAQPLPSSDV